MKLKNIMVALKPWDRGLPLTACHAHSLARAAEPRIQLVASAFDAAVGAAYDRGDVAARRTQERIVDLARAALERAAASVRNSSTAVTTRIIWGAPAYEAILAAAREWEADLLVIGANDRATRHARLTDTDWQLMRRTRHPLLLVKNTTFRGYGTVVAAVGSRHARDGADDLEQVVIEAGRCLAHAFGSRLRAVYARSGDAEQEWLARRAAIAPAELDLLDSSAPQAIVDATARHEAELLVIGTTQRRGVAAALHDDAVEQVAGGVPCDVLIVPLRNASQTVRRTCSKVG